ncbi:MAG: hypothetical protein CEN87_170 [Parcubacteria group bacterium Licking1014_1]|nr:MAG: hypothetical protein CEN87_170 [Parcubacteria group bacterium Licking1014_1]
MRRVFCPVNNGVNLSSHVRQKYYRNRKSERRSLRDNFNELTVKGYDHEMDRDSNRQDPQRFPALHGSARRSS